ncbi:hypothetical protein ACSS7Z_04405 [Microbacterium sp. A82]|uniref:hypothetical protein n=1 Tax=Microbacterium sp. A82 TaxID=3450452 RepID=UPI003F2FB049
MPASSSDEELNALLALAYSAEAHGLSLDEQARLKELQTPRATDEPQSSEDETDEMPEAEAHRHPMDSASTSRVFGWRGLLSAAAACLVLGGLVGGFVGALNSSSPYLSPDEILATYGSQFTSELEIEPPSDVDYDSGSLFLSTVINDRPVWIGTQDEGKSTCMYVDFGVPDANAGACVETATVGSIGATSNNPKLSPEDRGTYTLMIFEDALPFVTYAPPSL